MAGLTRLAWLQEQRRRDPQHAEQFFDCQACMENETTQTRQLMGCGYEPASPYACAWDGSSLGRKKTPGEPNVCPGYVCGLPEVIEASNAYLFLKNGGLLQFTDGEPPTADLRAAVVVLECENNAVVEWVSKEHAKGGA